MLRRKLPMGAVNLHKNVPGVDEQNRVLPLVMGFVIIEKPKRARERYGVKEVRTNGNHDIDRVFLNDLSADFQFHSALLNKQFTCILAFRAL
jgi:hypothetical protein